MIMRTSKFCLEQDLGTVARAVLTVFGPVPKTILALWPKMATGYINFGRIQIVENVQGKFSFDFFASRPQPGVRRLGGGLDGGRPSAGSSRPASTSRSPTGSSARVPIPPDPKTATFRCELTYEAVAPEDQPPRDGQHPPGGSSQA
jgi:hypothetical protein